MPPATLASYAAGLPSAQAQAQEIADAAQQAEADRLYEQGFQQHQSGQFDEALQSLQAALEIYQALGDRLGQAETLRGIGYAYRYVWRLDPQYTTETRDQAFDLALQAWQMALDLHRALGDRQGEVDILGDFGKFETERGNAQRALDWYQQRLTVVRGLGDRQEEGRTLSYLGQVSLALGDTAQSMDFLQQSLAMARELGDRQGEGLALANFGDIHFRENYENYLPGNPDFSQAIDFYQQSLAIAREIGDRDLEERNLTNLNNLLIEEQKPGFLGEVGSVDAADMAEEITSGMALYAASLNDARQGLAVAQELGDRRREGEALIRLGNTHLHLGQPQEAIGIFQQSLVIAREIGNRQAEGYALGGLGSAYYNLGQHSQAMDFLQQSLAIAREVNDAPLEARSLIHRGAIYRNTGQYPQALEALGQGLAIASQLPHWATLTEIPMALLNLGSVHEALGDGDSALYGYHQSLAVAQESGLREIEANALSTLGRFYQAKAQNELAVVFFKKAVNVYEDIRTGNRAFNLDQALQDSYTEKVAETYRTLADLLLDQGRILEAQQVLELLKAEELRQFTRASYAGGTLTYDPAEQPIVASHGSLIALGVAIAACDPNCDQTLYDQQIALERQFDQTVASFEQTVRQGRANDNVFYDPASLSSDALDLVNAQPGTVLIYPVVLEDRLWLLWTATGGVAGSVEVPVSQAELSRAAVRFRELLEHQDAQAYSEFKAVSQQLYGWLIAPMEAELEKNNIRHLIFAQDRTTRYLPMAALHDGSQYLLERYTLSTVLSAALTDTQGRLGDATSAQALGLGLTQAIPGFSPLPNVGQELRATIRAADNADQGIFPGQIFLDDAFTFEALSQNVRRANILHIATHAEFVPSTQGESYILSGTGERLALADIGALDTQFRNLHLVVLSACQTALGGAALDGTEIAGVSSYFLGPNKAKTVMATLWKVDDAGTSLLMQRFYALLATGDLTKAEALRQAQLSLLKGEADLDDRMATLGVSRGFELAAPEAASAGLAHPYYWAPFILIGNPL
ncbi:CHAT domain-containing protein [Phormidium sp. FACHB-1136]|nr:CHAT domain-containing protein [Phormidium sp. FACHB-1136]